jgi:predicted dehydrogenase
MTSNSHAALSRRCFVARASGLAAAVALPLPAAAWARVPGANDRVRLGVIGVGSRGRYLTQLFHAVPGVEVVALSDVYADNLREGAAKLARPARQHPDHRAVLNAADVDAVLIATPDHWHERMVTDAVRAGKDVYVEKPLTRTLDEAERMLRAVQSSDRVVQVGLQQRSGEHYWQAKREYFDTGRIGRVAQVRTTWYPTGTRSLPFTDQPAGLDWSAWLGPAAARPFDADQLLNWRWYWDFGGGNITDLFTHWVDVVHWFTGEDRPVSVSAAGGNLVFERPRPAPDTIALLLEYPGGHTVSFDCSAVSSGRGWGIEFLGTGGRLFIDRSQFTWTASEKGAEPVTVKAEEEGTAPHVRNFVQCVRSRATPNSDIESGFLATRASLLARRAFLQGEQINAR